MLGLKYTRVMVKKYSSIKYRQDVSFPNTQTFSLKRTVDTHEMICKQRLKKKIVATCLADSEVAKSFHKSCTRMKTQIKKQTQRQITRKPEDQEQQEPIPTTQKISNIVTSTFDSFPSSNTLNRANPAGVSNNTNISHQALKP